MSETSNYVCASAHRAILLNSTTCFSMDYDQHNKHDTVCYYFQNSTMNKIKFDDCKLYIISKILQDKLSSNIKHTYVITDYPKVYKHTISDDIITDCSKIMFNTSYKSTLTKDIKDDVYYLLETMTSSWSIKLCILL